MQITQPLRRIESVARDIGRLRDDVILENQDRPIAPFEDRWPWENLVAKANFLFDRIMDLDSAIQELVLTDRVGFDRELDAKVGDLVIGWHETCLDVLPHVDRLIQAGHHVVGAGKFRDNLSEARGILTDDREFFAGDHLDRLQDEAIDAHRAGLTEPMSNVGE